jgi:hypothetical protein
MAKKKVAKKPVASAQPPLDNDWVDNLPEDLADAVDEYLKAMRTKNKAAEKTRITKERCIELMQEHDIKKVRIDDGASWLVCEDKHGLKTQKAKKDELPPAE